MLRTWTYITRICSTRISGSFQGVGKWILDWRTKATDRRSVRRSTVKFFWAEFFWGFLTQSMNVQNWPWFRLRSIDCSCSFFEKINFWSVWIQGVTVLLVVYNMVSWFKVWSIGILSVVVLLVVYNAVSMFKLWSIGILTVVVLFVVYNVVSMF